MSEYIDPSFSKVITDNFVIHFVSTSLNVEFKVYPIIHFKKHSSNIRGFYYTAKEDGCEYNTEEFNEDTCAVILIGKIGFNGVWDKRFYFPNEEYFESELMEILALYKNTIKPWCMNYILNFNPDLNISAET